MPQPAAAIVIVGDEILTGHTQDTNSHWLARRLRADDVRVLRIETIADDPAEIEATLRRILVRDEPAFLFVVGGLGPTPDDRTYEGVRRALGVDLEVRAQHVAAMKSRIARRGMSNDAWADPERSEAMRRMIRIPVGSAALENPVGAALGCVAPAGRSRVAVFPGVPRELYAMYEESFAPVHVPKARKGREATRELEVRTAEAALWDTLTMLEREFPTIRLGSYPQDRRGLVVLRLAGPRPAVDAAFRRLRTATAALVLRPAKTPKRTGPRKRGERPKRKGKKIPGSRAG